MQEFNPTQRLQLHVFILGSSLLLFAAYEFALPDFRYYWDPSVKWFQILDLIHNGFADISCRYPARTYDPDFRHMPIAYASLIDGECRYWFPYQLSFVFAPLHTLLGIRSIPILQHGFTIFILYAMAIFCTRIGLRFALTVSALVLFRMGTANLNSIANLEDHTIATAICMGALLLLMPAAGKPGTRRSAAAGLTLALAFAFRPETALAAPFAASALVFMAKRYKQGMLRALSFCTGFALVLSGLLILNEAMTGHALGLRSIDPVNRIAYTEVGQRLTRALAHLFLAPEWWVNGLLFQMPLLAAVLLNPLRRLRAAPGWTPTAFALIVCCAIFPLAYIAPFGGPHMGFRFAAFLYPLLIPLALRPIQESGKWLRFPAALLSLYSILLSVALAVYGVFVYQGYRTTHRELKAISADAVLLRDELMWHVLSDHYYERPIMTALSRDHVEKLTGRLQADGKHRILLARSAARSSRLPLVPPRYAPQVKRRGKTAVLEWAVLDFSNSRKEKSTRPR